MTNKVRASLIEVATAIAILGLFAFFASPRFMSEGSSARVSALKDVQSAIQAAAILYAGKARMEKTDTLALGVMADGDTMIVTTYGAPQASLAGIGTAVEIEWANNLSKEFVYVAEEGGFYVAPSVLFTTPPSVHDLIASQCYLVYRERVAQGPYTTWLAPPQGC